MKGDRKAGPMLLGPALLLAIALTACGPSTNGQPGATSTPEVERLLTTDLQEFKGWLAEAVEARDFETMATLMRDPFDINSRGAGRSRRQPSVAIENVERFYPPEGMDLECGEDPPETVGDDLAIGTANSFLTRDADLYCTGWGPNGTGRALLLIHLDDEGYYYWTVFAVSTE